MLSRPNGLTDTETRANQVDAIKSSCRTRTNRKSASIYEQQVWGPVSKIPLGKFGDQSKLDAWASTHIDMETPSTRNYCPRDDEILQLRDS
ncbi:hypothetical protein AN958_07025 [Leucoagaricus sp. SymC.cos]|nr:hypothetical protein AN958_07025 [Leucoagaricus sp. SymC.cos]